MQVWYRDEVEEVDALGVRLEADREDCFCCWLYRNAPLVKTVRSSMRELVSRGDIHERSIRYVKETEATAVGEPFPKQTLLAEAT